MNGLTAVLVRRGVLGLSEGLRKGSGQVTASLGGLCHAGTVRKCVKSVIEVDVWERCFVFRLDFRTRAWAGRFGHRLGAVATSLLNRLVCVSRTWVVSY